LACCGCPEDEAKGKAELLAACCGDAAAVTKEKAELPDAVFAG